MKLCKGCGVAEAAIGNYCLSCKHAMNERFMASFAEGYAEADEEIRQANQHIYDDWSFKYTIGVDQASATADSKNTIDEQTLRDIFRTFDIKQEYWDNLYNANFFGSLWQKREPTKKPWPAPRISYDPAYNGWTVCDPVTDGWVKVPLEAVETMLGRSITLRPPPLYKHEILECAKRLLILLLVGPLQRLEAKHARYPERFREAICR